MAARVLLQRRALATAALGGLVFAPATVFAEAPEDYKRKPIYDDVDVPSPNPAPSTSLVPKFLSSAPAEEEHDKPRGPTPTDRVAVQIGKVRLALHKYAVGAEDALNNTVDSAFHLEQSFTGTIASLAPPRESGERLLPGAIYVLVAAMAGSIVTRNRTILLRATAPVVFGVLAANAVLPVTSKNVSDLAWTYEQRFPAVAESHLKARESILKGVSFARVHREVSARYVDEKVTDAREAVEGWVKQGK